MLPVSLRVNALKVRIHSTIQNGRGCFTKRLEPPVATSSFARINTSFHDFDSLFLRGVEILKRFYPTAIPPPRFTRQQSAMEKHIDTENVVVNDESQQTASHAVTTLNYVVPILCLLYITVLGWAYGCPLFIESLDVLQWYTNLEAKNLLAAALLVSSVGLITTGVRFLREDQSGKDENDM